MTLNVTEQFVEFYYQTFDGNRAGLTPLYVSAPFQLPSPRSIDTEPTIDLYEEFEHMLIGIGCGQRDQSMLTFETSSVQGAAAITEKLTVRLPLLSYTAQTAGRE